MAKQKPGYCSTDASAVTNQVISSNPSEAASHSNQSATKKQSFQRHQSALPLPGPAICPTEEEQHRTGPKLIQTSPEQE